MTRGCRCDRLIHPSPLRIAAGMETIPRQIATFPEFRRAMLAAVPTKPALSHWDPGGNSDLGEMLLEMWAYVCDSLSFYDEVIAHEEYLRTARRRPSVRKLTELIGHVPVPATAAEVELGIVAEGRKPLTLPTGSGFRSGAFDEEPPQVFEIGAPTSVHPLTSRWTLQAVRPDRLGTAVTDNLLLRADTASLVEDDVALLRFADAPSTLLAMKATSVEDHEGNDGESYARVTFDRLVVLGADRSPSTLRLEKPSATGGLWKGEISFETSSGRVLGVSTWGGFTVAQSASPAVAATSNVAIAGGGSAGPIATESGRSLILLDGLYRQVKPGDHIILERGDDRRGFRVTENREARIKVADGQDTKITDDDGTVSTVSGQPAYAPVTRLLLDATVDSRAPRGGTSWGSGSGVVNELVLRYGLTSAGVVTVEAKTRIENGDSLILQRPVEVPEDGTSPERFLLQDLDENGLATAGAVQLGQRTMSLDTETDLGKGLAVPVTVYGNAVRATRGETVAGEVLGSGDAAQPNQSFTLEKKPLTYLPVPVEDNDSGVSSTLHVRVGGVLWTETPSFFGHGPEDEVYIVSQDDDDRSIVTFGDGVRGSQLPTGTDNVTATYRYGAGEAAPPAGSITQMAKPVKGVASVVNPVAAFGGSDAEDREEIRTNAPRSALTLGRAVSLADMKALAAKAPGVRAAKADWRWHERRQRPVAQVWYVGDAGIASRVSAALRSASDPATPIDVTPSTPVPLHLSLAVQVDRRYVEDAVLESVRAALLDPDTGLLPPERVGIGAPLFRSRIFQQVLSVEGTVAVRSVQIRREDPPSLRASPAYGSLLLKASHALKTAEVEPSAGVGGWAFEPAPGGSLVITGYLPGPVGVGEDVTIPPALLPLAYFALSAPDGAHFDIEQGSLTLSGGEAQGG